METKTMTENEVKAEASKIFDEVWEASGRRLEYLKGRWEDEKEYEDWKDYDIEIRKLLAIYNIVKVIKVGVVIRTENFDLKIKITSRQVYWEIAKLNNVTIEK